MTHYGTGVALRDIILAIDVEPDGRRITKADPWNGVAVSLPELAAFRSQLEQATQAPVRFNWFLRFDPQIEQTWGRVDWITQACPDLIPWLRTQPDFTGIHPHFWRWSERHKTWMNDFSDAWQVRCVQTSIDGYRAVFGVTPPASRCGDHFLGNEIVRLLGKEGVRYDLTVEPGVSSRPLTDDPHATAWLPDYRSAKRVPYRPSAEDFLIPDSACAPADAGREGLWIVPISTTEQPNWMLLPRYPFAVRSSQPLILTLRPRALWKYLSNELSRQSAVPLVLVMRAGDLSQRRHLAAFRFVTERLARHPAIRACRFTRVDVAMDRFVGRSIREGANLHCLHRSG